MLAHEPEITRGAGVALWRQIARTLESEIRDGTFEPGSQLPTEAQLAERFDVNRHTLRRAVSSLQEAGLLRVEQGRGTFVQENIVDYPVTRRTRFDDIVRGMGREPGGDLIRAETRPADLQVAAGLGVPRGAPVVLLEILHTVDQRPVSLISHYFPRTRFSGLIEAYRETGSLPEALKRDGITDYYRRSSRVTAKLPSAEDARLLRMPRTQPVIISENVNVDDMGRVIEFGLQRAPAQRMQLVFEP